jgi:hypothetical protein
MLYVNISETMLSNILMFCITIIIIGDIIIRDTILKAYDSGPRSTTGTATQKTYTPLSTV